MLLTYGLEIELVDVIRKEPLPHNCRWARDEITLVNSNGEAVWSHDASKPLGGEINTPPTRSILEQIKILDCVFNELPESTINYRCNTQTHIGFLQRPSPTQIKKMMLYFYNNFEHLKSSSLDGATTNPPTEYYHKWITEIKTKYPTLQARIKYAESLGLARGKDWAAGSSKKNGNCIPSHTELMYLTDAIRLKLDIVKGMPPYTWNHYRHSNIPKHQIPYIEAASTEKELMAALFLDKAGRFAFNTFRRHMINFHSLHAHGTVEFRGFWATKDLELIQNCLEYSERFVMEALSDNPTPAKDWTYNWKFPVELPYDHELEKGFQETKAQKDDLRNNTVQPYTIYIL